MKRWDEIADGVTWAVAHNPTEFPIVIRSLSVRVAIIAAIGGVPNLRIFFKIVEPVVYLLWVEQVVATTPA